MKLGPANSIYYSTPFNIQICRRPYIQVHIILFERVFAVLGAGLGKKWQLTLQTAFRGLCVILLLFAFMDYLILGVYSFANAFFYAVLLNHKHSGLFPFSTVTPPLFFIWSDYLKKIPHRADTFPTIQSWKVFIFQTVKTRAPFYFYFFTLQILLVAALCICSTTCQGSLSQVIASRKTPTDSWFSFFLYRYAGLAIEAGCHPDRFIDQTRSYRSPA